MSLKNYNNKNIVSKGLKEIWKPLIHKILLIFALILVLLMIFIDPILNGILKPKVLNSLNKDNLKVNIGHLSYNFFTRNFLIENTVIKLNKSSKDNDLKKSPLLTEIKIPYCQFSGLNTFRLITGSGLKFENLVINNSHIFIDDSDPPGSKDPSEQNEQNSLTGKLLNFLPARFKPLNFEKFASNSLSLTRIIKGKEYQDSVKTFSINFNKLMIDSSAIDDSLKLKFADGFKISIKDLSYHFKNDYLLKLESLSVSSPDSIMEIKNLFYIPYVSDDAFFSGKKYSSDRYILKFPAISLRGINFKKIVREKEYIIGNIVSNGMYFNVCTNYRLPGNPSSIPKMPNELMREAKFKLDIKNISVKNAELHIKGRHKHVEKYSDVPFSNVNVDIKNLSNMQDKQTKENPCVFNGSGNMFDAGKLNLIIKIPLLEKKLSFDYYGSLSAMSALQINDQIKWADQIEIKSGKINSAEYKVHVLNRAADVYVKALYEDLKIEKLKENSEKGGVINKAATFLANSFKIRNSNPGEDGKIKKGTIIYLMKKGDTFPDFVWSAVKKALGEIVGY